jgi:hypothetical protein
MIAAFVATPAAASVRALFVGINDYAYSAESPEGEKAGFHNLHGAVADVGLMKSVLATTYNFKLDPLVAGGSACSGANRVSRTLLNGCATRDAIFAALRGLIKASAAGDIILFYFSGHGSWTQDMVGDQPTHENSTIVPTDARGPRPNPDILDTELRDWFAVANAAGISVVTIFDSCSSGTATRDIAPQLTARAAPPGVRPAMPAAPPEIRSLGTGAANAYLAHLAAVVDHGTANEVPVEIVGPAGTATEWHGLFTWALAAAIAERPKASYRELAADAARALERWGQTASPAVDDGLHHGTARLAIDASTRTSVAQQQTHAEGSLDAAFLGAPGVRDRAFDVAITDASTASLAFGRLSGVTDGSTYAVFASASDARLGHPPLAQAVVGGATQLSASLHLTPPLAAPRAAAYVVERVHAYGERLRVGVVGGCGDAATRVGQEFDALGFVVRDDRSPAYAVVLDCKTASFRAVDGRQIAALGDPHDDSFARRVGDVARAAANYFALTALRDDVPLPGARITVGRDVACDDPEQCVFPAMGDGSLRAQINDRLRVDVNNDGGAPFFAYALFLSGTDFRVQSLNEVENAKDNVVAPGDSLTLFTGRVGNRGKGSILVLLTRQPVSTTALRQEPVRDISGNELERLLLLAGAGQRGDTVVRTGDWHAELTRFTVE